MDMPFMDMPYVPYPFMDMPFMDMLFSTSKVLLKESQHFEYMLIQFG